MSAPLLVPATRSTHTHAQQRAEIVKDYEIKGEIVRVAHMMSDRGLVGTYEGNISARRGDRMYVTRAQ